MKNISGIYGIGHITYLILSLILIIVGAIIICKYVKSQEKRTLIIKISGIVLLIMILINRFSVTYHDVVIAKREGYSWVNLIPNTFCGLSSLVLSLAIIFGKKDNIILHSIGYVGFVGGAITMFYPDFLSTQDFGDIRSLSGLIHHTLMVWIVLISMLTKYINPSMSKWPILPLGLCVIMTLGLLEIELLGFVKAMQINDPLLSSLPVLTSWYMVGFILLILHFMFLVIYEKTVNHKSWKDIFSFNK